MTPGHCAQPAPSGQHCRYPAGRCPFHPAPRHEPDGESEPGAESPDPHRYIHNALTAVIEGKFSPTVIARLVRTLEIANRLGPPPVDDARRAEEISLRGSVMHGMPPLTERQWLLARDLFEPGALHMMALWLKPYDPPPPDWLQDIPNPGEDFFPPISRETFRDHSFDYQPLPASSYSLDPNEPELQL